MIRKNFFLKKKYFFMFVGIILISWIIVISPYHLLPIILSFFFLFFNRKKTISWKDNLKNDGSILLSPVSGEVVEIKQYNNAEGIEFAELRVIVKPFNYWGLHLPFSSEMEYLKSQRGKFLARKDLASYQYVDHDHMTKTDMTLRSRFGQSLNMTFIHSRFGRSPKIWMKSGDRGRGAACFGYYPYGGSLIIYIPKPCDVLVIKGEQLIPGHTVIAVSKKTEEE